VGVITKRAAEQRSELSPRRVCEPWEKGAGLIPSRGAAAEFVDFDGSASLASRSPLRGSES
jgi:hypothetical protein